MLAKMVSLNAQKPGFEIYFGGKLDALAEVVRTHWPVEIANTDLQSPALIRNVEKARSELLDVLDLRPLS